MDIVVNYNPEKKEFQIYESISKTLLESQTLGEGFSELNLFLLQEGEIEKSILEDQNVTYHFDSYTFQEIIKSNIALIKRVQDIPSEFKNSASKFGTGLSKENPKGKSNFQRHKFNGFGASNFGKSYSKFSKKK